MGKVAGLLLAGFMVAAGSAGATAAVGERDGAAAVKNPPSGRAQGLKRFDADEDQAVTLEEFLKRRVEAFSRRDKNRDGTLDAAELGQAPLGFRQQRSARRLDQMLLTLDADKDGKVTKAEFETAPAGGREREARRGMERRQLMFSFYDRNGDGVVERPEYEAGRAEEADFAKRRRMHALDRNGDGSVTLEEFTADARFRFQRLDLDRDGRITAPDLPPAERQRWTQR